MRRFRGVDPVIDGRYERDSMVAQFPLDRDC